MMDKNLVFGVILAIALLIITMKATKTSAYVSLGAEEEEEGLTTRVGILEQSLVTTNALLDTKSSLIDTMSAEIVTLQANVTLLETKITEVDTAVQNIPETDTTTTDTTPVYVEYDDTQVKLYIQILQDEMSDQQARVDADTIYDDTTVTQDITTLADDITSLTERVLFIES